MKIGFSTLACPGWDLERVVSFAAEHGFDGVELRGLRGELDLPLVPTLSRDPVGVKRLFRDRKIECVSLGTSVTLTARGAKELANQQAALVEVMELASALGCPNVRLFLGDIEATDTPSVALTRISSALAALVPVAIRLDVRLLIENGGGFPSSRDIWFVVDSVSHPMVQACWNQCNALTVCERATNSIPCLGTKIEMVHVCDADFDDEGVLLGYRPLGQGGAEVGRQIELLRGLMYQGYLMFEWPKLWVPSLGNPENVLPQVATFLRELLDAKQVVLSAYKGDKKVPRLARPVTTPTPTPTDSSPPSDATGATPTAATSTPATGA